MPLFHRRQRTGELVSTAASLSESLEWNILFPSALLPDFVLISMFLEALHVLYSA